MRLALPGRCGPDALADLAVACDGGAVRGAVRGGPAGRARCRAGRGHARPGRRSGRHRGAAGRPGRTGTQPGVAERRAGSASLAERTRRSADAPRCVALDGRPGPRPGHQPRSRRDGRRPDATGPAPDGRRRCPGTPVGRSRRAEVPGGLFPTTTTPERGADPERGHESGCRPCRWATVRPPTSRWAMPWPPSTPNGSSSQPGRSPATRSGSVSSPGCSGHSPRGRQGPRDPRPIPLPPLRRRRPQARRCTQTFLEIANDSPYPIRLACLLDAPASAAVETSAAGSAWLRRPRPAAATWSSTCSPSASRRSGSGRLASRSRR